MTTIEEIRLWKEKKDAVLLAHYYVPAEIQAIADYTGDSYYLSKTAAALDCKTLVFCGVSFMGDSAKLLSPDKTVLMPDKYADCPMAHMAAPATVKAMREQYDDLAVVCYINSTTELKACSDVCVTSANALHIVKALPNKNIFFIPDQNLAHFIASQIPEKHFIFNDGFCPTHQSLRLDEVKQGKKLHPRALVLSHPECTREVLAVSDYIGSTSGIIRYATESDATEFIICTECGVLYQLQQRNPDKKFYFPSSIPQCPNMKRNTLEKVLHVLQTGENEVHVPPELQEAAKQPLARMLELAAKPLPEVEEKR